MYRVQIREYCSGTLLKRLHLPISYDRSIGTVSRKILTLFSVRGTIVRNSERVRFVRKSGCYNYTTQNKMVLQKYQCSRKSFTSF